MTRRTLIERYKPLVGALLLIGLVVVIVMVVRDWMSAAEDNSLRLIPGMLREDTWLVLVIGASIVGFILFGIFLSWCSRRWESMPRASGWRPWLRRVVKAAALALLTLPVSIPLAWLLHGDAYTMPEIPPHLRERILRMMIDHVVTIYSIGGVVALGLVCAWPPLIIRYDRELRKAARDGARGESDTTPARG